MKNCKLIFFTLILMTNLSISCKGQNDRQQEPDLKALSKKTNTAIIDVRTIEEFESGHVEKSVNIPLQVIADSVQSLKRFDHIILICRSGNRSEKAKSILEESGLKNVYNGGGWESFREKIK